MDLLASTVDRTAHDHTTAARTAMAQMFAKVANWLANEVCLTLQLVRLSLNLPRCPLTVCPRRSFR